MPTLKELIAEAQRTGGFGYYSTESTVNGKGYQLLAHKGFKIDEDLIIGACCRVDGGLVESMKGRKLGFNEAVFYGIATCCKQIGEKRVGIFRKEPVFDFAPVQTGEVLASGSQEPASNLVYLAARAEPDAGGRQGALITQGIIASTCLIERLIEELKKQPGQAGAIFQGVFPDYEKKYHIQPNGKILIATRQEVSSGNISGVYNFFCPNYETT